MIRLLAKLFIKNNKDHKNQTVREKYGILCGGFGIFLNVILFALKFHFLHETCNSIALAPRNWTLDKV